MSTLTTDKKIWIDTYLAAVANGSTVTEAERLANRAVATYFPELREPTAVSVESNKPVTPPAPPPYNRSNDVVDLIRTTFRELSDYDIIYPTNVGTNDDGFYRITFGGWNIQETTAGIANTDVGDEFRLAINTVYVDSDYYTAYNSGSAVIIDMNQNLNFSLSLSDRIELRGRFNQSS
jgi:hypothetical protein